MAETVPHVYQFKITLRGTRPRIWRRIQVPENYNFYYLHVAITDAMGWVDCHRHDFLVADPVTRRKIHIGKPMDEDDFYYVETLPEKTTKIADYFLFPTDRARHDYDFRDDWEHDVVLEKILPATPGMKYPRCLAGRLACPPEKCGGIWGFKRLLKILANPQHEEYEERIRHMEHWGCVNFDPQKFDPASVKFRDPEIRWEMAFQVGFV